MYKDGVNGVDGLLQASDVTVSPDGSHVYTTGASDYAVAVFSMDSSTATTSLGD
jgi:6-phosphogluconolactonase (cycloisomerase 2 family)